MTLPLSRHSYPLTIEGVIQVEKLLLSPEEAAEVLGVTRSTIYDLLRMRILKSVKIGRRRLVPVQACRELVEHMVEESA